MKNTNKHEAFVGAVKKEKQKTKKNLVVHRRCKKPRNREYG
jgi:hypothetical protein